MNLIQKIQNAFNFKVLYCDLDGTLTETKSGKTFPENEDDWQFKDHIKEAIVEYNPKYIFIVTNQGGIEKGFVDEIKFLTKIESIVGEIQTWGDFIVDYAYCSTNDPGCSFRKPNPGMITFLRRLYPHPRRRALMIGDASGLSGQFSDSDLRCARSAGIRYCDVDRFIGAMCPCYTCAMSGIECYQGTYPCPKDIFKEQRLREAISK